VFYLSAEIYTFGAIIFLILGTGNKQWWADGPMVSNCKILPLKPQDSLEGETEMDPFTHLEEETETDPFITLEGETDTSSLDTNSLVSTT
jgi:hypothetical protein